MTRTPQPMRRMRYLIGELISQGLVPENDLSLFEWLQAWLGGVYQSLARIEIRHEEGEWFVTGYLGGISIIKMPILTAPGPETVWIGPDLTPILIQPRNPRSVEVAQAENLGD